MTRVFFFDVEGKILLATNIPDNQPYIIIVKEGGSIYKAVDPTVDIVKNTGIKAIERMTQ